MYTVEPPVLSAYTRKIKREIISKYKIQFLTVLFNDLTIDSESGNVAFLVIHVLILCDVNIHSGLQCLNATNLGSKTNRVTLLYQRRNLLREGRQLVCCMYCLYLVAEW